MKKKWLGIGDFESEEEFYDDILRHRIEFAKKERERLGLKPDEPLPLSENSSTAEELREAIEKSRANRPPHLKKLLTKEEP